MVTHIIYQKISNLLMTAKEKNQLSSQKDHVIIIQDSRVFFDRENPKSNGQKLLQTDFKWLAKGSDV